MNGDDARARFDAAIDDELDGGERAAFEAALARDPALRDEFVRHRRVVEATRALASAPPVDLLGGVQQKLRARSGGKFYRDRFAVEQGRTRTIGWMLGASAALVLLVALWLAYDAGLLG